MRDIWINKLFFACVDFLTYLGEKLKLSYEEVNIWIFCIIWPIITLLSLGMNFYFLFLYS